ncbi:hypothetical protein PSY15_24200, partial [Shigella flexneri]|nr:hypothetical protein [Shigella flexneri]
MEYIPIAIVLMLFMEMNGAETWMPQICTIQVSAPFISINSISTIAVEYIPIAIVLMLFMEMNGAETWMPQ